MQQVIFFYPSLVYSLHVYVSRFDQYDYMIYGGGSVIREGEGG